MSGGAPVTIGSFNEVGKFILAAVVGLALIGFIAFYVGKKSNTTTGATGTPVPPDYVTPVSLLLAIGIIGFFFTHRAK